jgi:hypothetical protein
MRTEVLTTNLFDCFYWMANLCSEEFSYFENMRTEVLTTNLFDCFYSRADEP